mgnify:CR=1 FL=1
MICQKMISGDGLGMLAEAFRANVGLSKILAARIDKWLMCGKIGGAKIDDRIIQFITGVVSLIWHWLNWFDCGSLHFESVYLIWQCFPWFGVDCFGLDFVSRILCYSVLRLAFDVLNCWRQYPALWRRFIGSRLDYHDEALIVFLLCLFLAVLFRFFGLILMSSI